MRRFCSYAFSGVFLLLSACSTHQVPPRVSLINVEFGDVALFESTLKTTIRYQNRSSSAISISGSFHELRLDGIDVGSAASDRDVTIPPLGSKVDTLIFYIDNLALIHRIRPLIEQRDMTYELRSTVYSGPFSWIGGDTVIRKGRFADLVPLEPLEN